MVRPTERNYVTCPYGQPGSWAAGYHTGIDYRADRGENIYATRGGTIEHAGGNCPYGSAYGNAVILRTFFRGTTRKVLYAHFDSVLVSAGDKVKAGDVLGYAGDSGNAFGTHLHYEERTAPYGYNNHYRPVLTAWQPKDKAWLQTVLLKIGVLKNPLHRLRLRNKK